jgi:hypothetical protein
MTTKLLARTLLGAAMLLGAAWGVAPTSAAAATPATQAPYSDPAATGYLGICNQAGQQVTSGSVSARPFAWKVVSSVPASPPYNDANRTAVLLAYQPRQGFLPGEWSGEAMTASSSYSNPAAPMVAGTARDYSLQDFLSDFPASWNGFVQLRVYLGTANQAPLSSRYPALSLQVIGGAWRAIGGGAVDCSAGTATSLEAVLLPSSTTSTMAGSSGARATTTTVPRSSTTAGARSSRSAGGGSGGSGAAIGITALAAVAAAAGGLLLWRRRSTGDSKPGD